MIKKLVDRRRLLAFTLVVVVIAVFAGRLFSLQVVQAEQLTAEAQGQIGVESVLQAVRGDIVDRNGSVLATTRELYDAKLSPKNTRENKGIFYRFNQSTGNREKVTTEAALTEIAAIVGRPAEELIKAVNDELAENPKSDFMYVKRGIDLGQLRQLKELGVPWMTYESVFDRSYPNGAVAGNLLGYQWEDNGPKFAGIERSQNECLTGEDGFETYERSADGMALPGSRVEVKKRTNGGKVALTIDRDLQYQVQQIVNLAREKTGAEWAMHVVMNAKTGELLAVAEDNSVDPNNTAASDPSRLGSRAFSSPYEPGSSFKALTAAMAINEGKATAITQSSTPYEWRPEPGVVFSDAYPHPETRWTLAGILAVSSNVGTTMIGGRVDKNVRYEYLKKFGLGQATEAGMPYEESGLLYPAAEWDAQSSYNIMFGQGVSSTIIQTAGAYQALANKGLRIPPSLVKSCTSDNGEVTEFNHGEPVRVVSEQTAAEVTDILENVANYGTVYDRVHIDGYRVVGKTATAEQSDGRGGYRSDYINSFAGYFPADDPQYVVVSSIAFPQRSSSVAGTSWRDTVRATIRHFQVPPSQGEYRKLPLEY
ncbi:penicillin-binding protein 2 [Canibacter sp. lx-72]|uniref:peptidoglycan D,D-transpeptidase FtsI family protein n=1 Tax=Canibacter zhuwentaonis TaxID=2837491 RepID=UPI001BDC069B|nr:penicillin-binding protein 2 [Canibacter zhuwentaonis]